MSKARRNPLTKLAALAFADQDPLFLNEMRKAEEKYDFETAALALSEWTGCGHEEMRAYGLRAISDYVRTKFEYANKALYWLGSVDKRLCAWCSCACARKALKFLPKGENRPRIAIKTTEAWVRGKASIDQVKRAEENAVKAYRFMDYVFTDYSGYTITPAAYAWNQVPSGEGPEWDDAEDEEDRRLLDVVANAIMRFPQPSR